MASRALYPVVDSALGGKLADELIRLRAEGLSHESIARWFLTEHGIEVSIELVRRWVNKLPGEPRRSRQVAS